MPRHSKNNFEIVGDEIHITRDDWPIIGLTTYREDYYKEICSKTWRLTDPNSDGDDKGYITNSGLGLLHRYIVSKWYGDEVLNDLTQKGYVIDHMNNNHADCRISNLEFLKKAYNTAKGQAFDIDARKMRHHIAVNLFKDFSTDCYQITIGCNDTIVGYDENGHKYYVNDFKLLYNCDYSIVINDAENILRLYDTEGRLELSKTHACDMKISKAPDIQITEDEKDHVIVYRDGDPYLVLGTGNAWLYSVQFEKGWTPPENNA